MKPRTLIAVQFGLWALFFSNIIPFAGDFLLPIVWIYDKKVFLGALGAQLVQMVRLVPGALGLVPVTELKNLPAWWSLTTATPLVLLLTGASITWTTYFTAWFLKRKIRKKAPDLLTIA